MSCSCGGPVGGDRRVGGDHLPGARPRRRPHRRGQHLPRPRASAPGLPRSPADAARDATELLQRVNHDGISPRARPRPAAGRPADRVDRPVALARRPPPDHGRAVRDPGRQRDRAPCSASSAGCAADGVGVVYISHRLDEIRRIGDRVTVLSEGVTVASGLPATTQRRRPGDADGRAEARAAVPRAPESAATTSCYRARAAPSARRRSEATFELRAGEVLGIAGLVGAGRSELLRAVYGVDRRDAGEVLVDGGLAVRAARQGDRGGARVWRRRTASRRPSCSSGASTKNVTLPDIARFQRVLISVRAERAAADQELRRSRTRPADPDRMARELSGGNQQKVCSALAARQCTGAAARRADPRRRRRRPRLSCTASSPDWPSRASACVVVSSRSANCSGCASRILVMREGELVAEVDGEHGNRDRHLAAFDAGDTADGDDRCAAVRRIVD